MDRIANPLFKAGVAAITATALVITPTVVPAARHAAAPPDFRSTPVRLSALAFTPRVPDAALNALTALKFPLPPTAPEAASVPMSPRLLAPVTRPAPAVQPRTAAVQSPATTSAPSGSGISAAAAGPVVANSLTDGIDQAYQFIQYWVDYGVDLAQWGAGYVPVIGGLISAQIGIVYDNLVRPIANSFVYNLVDPIINDPSFSNIVNSFGRFGGDIVNSVINFAWAEARYFLPPLPPLPGFVAQAAPETVSTLPTSVHEALAPFTKGIKDAEAHIADALGLTKVDHKLVSIEKPSTAAETTTDSDKEDGKDTATGAATDTKESKDKQHEKESADSKTPTRDKVIGGVGKEQKTKDKDTADGKGVTTEGAKDSPKETVPSGAVTGTDETSGTAAEVTKGTKDTENAQDSGKDVKSPTGVVTRNKPKVPAASTTEHGTVSAQGTVRGSTSQSTTGKTSTDKTDSAKTTSSGASASDAKTSDKKTKDSDTKTSGTKSPGTTAAHDSASKSAGSASSSNKSGGEGSKSGGGASKSGGSSHD